MNVWTEHRNPEGRTYWFNTGTRESVWEKPDDLKTPFERALNQTPWKEYFSGGRKYYYNTQSKESKWDMPDELLLLLEKVEKDGKAAPASAPGAPGMIAAPPAAQQNALVAQGHDGAGQPGTDQNGVPSALPLNSSTVLPPRPNLPDEPTIPHNGFATVEEGERAFTYLLRKAGVDPNWTWDQTMRAIITDPLYKALNTLGEKKAVYQKYIDALRAKEQEEREARLGKIRPAIRNMLKGNPNVFHYTTFATADKLFAQHPIWQQAKIEAERRMIFEEYVAELKQREVQEGRASRTRAVSKLVSVFKQLEVDVLTRWRTAHALVLDSEEWNQDPELQKLPNLDILLAFEDYSRVREREFDEQMRRRQMEKTRRERKAREGFKALLRERVESGDIKARTKWKHVYPTFANDDRYLELLGKPGSNPIELFWDVVDELDQKLDAKISVVESAIRRHNAAIPSDKDGDVKMNGEGPKPFNVTSETTEEEFLKVMKADTDPSMNDLSTQELKDIFITLREQATKQQADEKRRAERRQRHMQDDLRYAMKKVTPAIEVNATYEEAVPLIESLPEYKALDDEGRRVAFAKYIRRQKERLREISEDGGSTTSRRRKEPSHREPEREREKEKEKEKDRDVRERDRDRDHGRDHDRDRDRSSRYAHRERDEVDAHRRSSRDYPRDRDRSRDSHRDLRDKERERDRYGYRGSKHHREPDRDERKRRDEHREDRERSTSVFRGDGGEKRDLPVEEKHEERAEKRPRYERDAEAAKEEARPPQPAVRAETPEEGEI